MFVLLRWLTVSASAVQRGHFYLVKLKRIWIIDGENDTSVARGNERPTPSSLLSLLWLTESSNKDDTWQLTRPITGRDIHRERRREENGMKSKIERKQNIRRGQMSSWHLTSGWPNNLCLCPVRNWVEISFNIQQPILEREQRTVAHTGLWTIEKREREKKRTRKIVD